MGFTGGFWVKVLQEVAVGLLAGVTVLSEDVRGRLLPTSLTWEEEGDLSSSLTVHPELASLGRWAFPRGSSQYSSLLPMEQVVQERDRVR